LINFTILTNICSWQINKSVWFLKKSSTYKKLKDRLGGNNQIIFRDNAIRRNFLMIKNAIYYQPSTIGLFFRIVLNELKVESSLYQTLHQAWYSIRNIYLLFVMVKLHLSFFGSAFYHCLESSAILSQSWLIENIIFLTFLEF
jgi:hypothetical protein